MLPWQFSRIPWFAAMVPTFAFEVRVPFSRDSAFTWLLSSMDSGLLAGGPLYSSMTSF